MIYLPNLYIRWRSAYHTLLVLWAISTNTICIVYRSRIITKHITVLYNNLDRIILRETQCNSNYTNTTACNRVCFITGISFLMWPSAGSLPSNGPVHTERCSLVPRLLEEPWWSLCTAAQPSPGCTDGSRTILGAGFLADKDYWRTPQPSCGVQRVPYPYRSLCFLGIELMGFSPLASLSLSRISVHTLARKASAQSK